MMKHSVLVGVLILLPLLVGCSRPFVAKAKLDKQETVKVNDPVFVDGVQAGQVKNVRVENGERVADLAINDKAIVNQKFRMGIVRVKEEGRIALYSDGVAAGAEALNSGTVIPTKNKPEYLVQKYATRQTLIAVAIGLVAVLVLGLVVKSVTNLGFALLVLLLALFTAWILHPHGVPVVQSVYSSTPPTESEASEESDVASVGEAEGAGRTELSLVEIMNRRPDPRIVSFVMFGVVGFVFYGILLGAAFRSMRRRK